MSQSNSRYDTTFIDTSGGVLTEQLVRKLREEQCSEAAVKPTTFELDGDGPATRTEFETAVTDAWESLKERWDSLSQNNEIFSLDTSGIRDKWTIPLLKELGFDPVYQQSNLEADGIDANLSHLGWTPAGKLTASRYDDTPPILHLVQPDDDPAHTLDSGAHAGSGSSGQSPHDELQRFLNAADQQWSVVTDGLKLRILRDYYHTYTRGYIEFDLENIFTNRNFEDFRALYRLCHASRFIESEKSDAPLEELYQVALATGVKIGEDLQSNVVEALETLGNGFLNPELRRELAEADQEATDAYFQDLLRIVYRLLFLLFAEQRGMMSDRNDLYTDEYSITALRDRSERNTSTRDRKRDLWEGLQVTFGVVGSGYTDENLHIPGYNGGLFDDDELNYVMDASCPNQELLDAIHKLTHVEQDGYQQRISYADLGVDEIGAVYESLLEFTPQLANTQVTVGDEQISAGTFYLDSGGTDRKESGSYYTDPQLVHELIKTSLKPKVDQITNSDSAADNPADDILDLTVCDPACGSGAFLTAATDYLGDRLAKIREGTDYPSPEAKAEARRDVVQDCIYGVDMNPLAVELAKVSLWIKSAVSDKPLNFLDHRIRCGNSMIGADAELVGGEFPVDVYETSGGEDWHDGNDVRATVRKQNKARSRGSNDRSLSNWSSDQRALADSVSTINDIDDVTVENIQMKETLYDEFRDTPEFEREKLVRDVWTAAAYWPMDGSSGAYPTPDTLDKIRRNPDPEDEQLQQTIDLAKELSSTQGFFHWDIEFPEIFLGNSDGFDVILGNPPWEKPKINEKEWFTGKHRAIAQTDSQNKRQELISDLEDSNPELYEAFQKAQTRVSQLTDFLRNSEKYPLSGRGDINTYPIFTELCADRLVASDGRVGLVVKTGIATDWGTRHLFGEFVDGDRIVSLHDFENTNGIFEDVERNERFCLLTIAGSATTIEEGEFSFHNQEIEDLTSGRRVYTMSIEDFRLVNPNTKNCPTFRNTRIRDIVLPFYRKFGVLVNEESNSNPWNLDSTRMLDMSTDSSKFSSNTLSNLEDAGLSLTADNRFVGDDETYLPLYEGKYVHQFDHRFGTFEGVPEEARFNTKAETKKPTDTDKSDWEFEVLPRYWVEQSDFEDEMSSIDWQEDWFVSFRKIVRAHTDIRTAVGTITPRYPHGDGIPILTFDVKEPRTTALEFLSLFNSFVFDFTMRQSIGGANLNKYILKQLPMPAPSVLENYTVEYDGETEQLDQFLSQRVLQLVWTSHSLDGLQSDTQPAGPFDWNGDRRTTRAELEAVVAHLYDVSRDDFSYIIDQFEVLRDKELDKFDTFKTKSEALEKFDMLALIVD